MHWVGSKSKHPGIHNPLRCAEMCSLPKVVSLRRCEWTSARTMLLALAKGHALLEELQPGTMASIEELAVRENRSPRSIAMTISLAFLAPDIVQAILDSALPRGIGVAQLLTLPAYWSQQRAALGIL